MAALAQRLLLELTPVQEEVVPVEPAAIVAAPIEHADVIMMTGTHMRHALLRRAIRARGNEYAIRTIGVRNRMVWPYR